MDEEEKDIELDKEGLDDSVIAEEHANDTVKKLREKLKEAESKAKEYLDGWQRAQADFIAQFIPVLDSLELSLQHGNKELEAVYNQFISILKSNGLEEQNPEGESFDPRFHESVGIVETENQDEDHKILEVIQKGYILIGKIIRPAKVKIGE